MNATLPEKNIEYQGPITDTHRWQNFKHRPDDIFICTPPKCGTTWTQAIVCMLVLGRADHNEKPGVLSPWIDANFAPIDDYLMMVDSQTHRRFIKTHTPLDGIPFFPECTYLVVERDPRDMYFSLINHMDNMSDEELALSISPAKDGGGFQDWVTRPFNPSDFDVQTLEGACRFLTSYWAHRDLANIHFYHYADMKSDLRGHIGRLAAALGYSPSDEQLAEMTHAATFENMQKKGDQFAPMAGHDQWKDENRFFATGKNAQWRDKLSAEDLAAFDSKLQTLLDPEQIAWLVRN